MARRRGSTVATDIAEVLLPSLVRKQLIRVRSWDGKGRLPREVLDAAEDVLERSRLLDGIEEADDEVSPEDMIHDTHLDEGEDLEDEEQVPEPPPPPPPRAKAKKKSSKKAAARKG